MNKAPFTMDEIDDKLNELTKSVEPPKDSKDLGKFYSKFYEKFNLGDKDNIQPYTYWRKESAPFYAYPLMYRNVIVWLRPNATEEKILENYFECKMETLAEFVNNGLVSVVMEEPSGYFEGNGRPKEPYKSFFENLKQDKSITYSNSYEEAILNNDEYIDKLIDKEAKEKIESRGGMIRFGDWVEYMEKQSPFDKLPDKLSKPILYPPESKHPLIVDKPRNFVVERYCRLKLLEMVEKSGAFSAKLEGYVRKYPVKKILEDIVIPAFVFNYYSVPDFYSRGGFTTWHSWDMQQLSEIVLDYSGIGTKACSTITCLRTAFFCEKKETKELLIDSHKIDHKKMLKQMMHIKSESDEFYNIMNNYPAVWDNVLKKNEKLVRKGEEDVKKYFEDIDKFAINYISVINILNEERAKILEKAAKIESGTKNFTSSIIRGAHNVHIIHEMYELLTEGIVPHLLPVSIIAAHFLEKPISERCGEAAEEFYFTRKTGLPFNLWGVRI